jgi:hypothetical protein
MPAPDRRAAHSWRPFMTTKLDRSKCSTSRSETILAIVPAVANLLSAAARPRAASSGLEPCIQAAPFGDQARAEPVHDETESGSAYFWAFPAPGARRKRRIAATS